MVSRRKILSRSRDDLNLDQSFNPQEEEEDVWYQKDKLYKEHIQEVLDKWTQIDDEIWAKVIVFERNRRVAKAYARAPVLTINGSDDGFDGMRIGLCGFDNPMRDPKTEELKRHIGQGVKIKMDDAGNILIRRYAKSNVYVKSTASSPNEETSIGADILKLQNQALESEKIVKLFDMKKFQSNVNRELRRAYPDRRRLETQCLSAVAFVKSESDILECPIWVLIVNVVAMDMLKSKLPPAQRPMVDIKNRPRIPIPDEDPYSVAGNGSGGSSGSSGFGAGSSSNNNSSNGHQQSNGNGAGISNGNSNGIHMNNGHVAATREQLLLQTQQLAYKRSEKPPKLPPRDNIYSHDIIPKPDYDDVELASREVKLSRGKSDKGKDNKKYDDPYYCGLRARVPNFVKSSKTSKELKEHGPLNNISTNGVGVMGHSGMNTLSQKKTSMIHHAGIHMHPHHSMLHHTANVAPHHHLHHHHNQHNPMWQTRNFVENSLGIYDYRPVKMKKMKVKTGTNYYADGQQRTTTRPERTTLNQQQQQPHHSRMRSQSQSGRPAERIYYDDVMRAKRHARSERRDNLNVEYCNCVSCHALAPLFGAVQPVRPPRSLSQQLLSEHRRLSGAGFNDPNERLVKWCSESDISELERNNFDDDAPYELESEQHNLYGKVLDIDFDTDTHFDFESLSRRHNSADKRATATDKRIEPLRQSRQHEDKLQVASCMHKLRHRQRLPERIPLNAMKEKQSGKMDDGSTVSYERPLQKQNRACSIESFFEQPNEEGSLYMYGGRKRIPKAPSTTNLYERTDTLTTYNSDRRREYEGIRGLLKFNNKTNDSYNNNKNKNEGCGNNNNNKNDHRKTHLTTDNSQARRTESRTIKPPLPPPCWRNNNNNNNNNRRNTNNNNSNNNNSNNKNNISIAIAKKIENLQKQHRKLQQQQDNANTKHNDVKKAQLTNNKNNKNNKNNIIKTKTTTTTNMTKNNAPERLNLRTQALETQDASIRISPPTPPPAQTQPHAQTQHQRQSRPTSRLDISDLESIYGYLKPRKPRSLSLKKIQIHDY